MTANGNKQNDAVIIFLLMIANFFSILAYPRSSEETLENCLTSYFTQKAAGTFVNNRYIGDKILNLAKYSLQTQQSAGLGPRENSREREKQRGRQGKQ